MRFKWTPALLVLFIGAFAGLSAEPEPIGATITGLAADPAPSGATITGLAAEPSGATFDQVLRILEQSDVRANVRGKQDVILTFHIDSSSTNELATHMLRPGYVTTRGDPGESPCEGLLPEVTVDIQNDRAIVSLPQIHNSSGFNDSVCQIGRIYYLRRILENVKRVKSIFYIGETSFESENIDKLNLYMSRATQMYSHVGGLKDSVGLVISECSCYDANDTAEAGVKHQKYMINSLKPELQNKLEINDDPQEILQLEKNIKILEYFSKTNLKNIVCVGKSMPDSQKKSEIQTMVFKNISYSDVNMNLLTFNLSKNSVDLINNELIVAVDTNLKSNLEDLISNVKKTFDKNAKIYIQDQKFVDENNLLQNQFKLLKDKVLVDKSALKEFVLFCVDYIRTAYYSEAKIKTIVNHVDYLHFFMDFVKQPNYLLAYQELASTELTRLQNLKTWYDLTLELRKSLPTYKIISDINFDSYFDNNVSLTTQDLVKQFLDKTEHNNLADKNLITALRNDVTQIPTVNENIVAEINRVLLYTLRSETKVEIKDQVLEIRGHFLVTSQIKELKPCGVHREIKLIASHTIFIDSNIECNSGSNLIITAPRVEIVNSNSIISLNGQHGQSQSGNAAAGSQGNAGKNGVEGGTGKSAGNFLLISDEIINCNNLKVLANGGNGGNGQRGGDGFPGKSPDFVQIHDKSVADKLNKKLRDMGLESPYQRQEYNYIYIDSRKGFAAPTNGGNGGSGGVAGKAGHVEIIVNNDKCNVQAEAKDGTSGQPGAGGNKFTAHKMSRSGHKKKKGTMPCSPDQSKYKNTHVEDVTSNAGQSGAKPAQPAPALAAIGTTSSILNFKSYYRQHLIKNNAFENENNMFINFLHTDNNKILKHCDAICFAKDLTDVETVYSKITYKNADTQKQYNLLMLALEKSELSKTSPVEYKAIVNTLNGKLSHTTQNTIVTNLNVYIDTSLNLMKSIDKNAKTVVSFDTQHAYVSDLQSLIDEGNNYIQNHVSTELKSIEDTFDNAYQTLLQDIDNIETELIETSNELKDKRKALERTARKNVAFGVLGSIASVASIFVPVVGSVTQATLSVASATSRSARRANVTLKTKEEFTVDQSVQLIEQFYNPRTQAVGNLKNSLDKLLEVNLPNIMEKINEVKTKLTELYSLKNLFNMRNIKSEAIKIVSELKDFIIKSNNTSSRAMSNLNAGTYLQTSINVFESSDTISNSISACQTAGNNLEEIDLAIQEINERLSELREFEEQVYADVGPMLEQMHADLSNFIQSSTSSNSVDLEIKSWQANSYLLKLKSTLNDLVISDDMKSDEQFAKGIVEIENLINLVLSLLNRAQEFQQQQKLATYIQEINSADLETLVFKNPEFKAEYSRLKLSIQSNILYDEYVFIKSAFEQQIFPFGAKELEILKLDSTNDLNAMTAAVMHNIEAIKNKLTKMQSSINTEIDPSIILTPFNYNFKLSKPFYVWQEKEHLNDIQNFRKGSEIVLNADILSSDPSLNAVKFTLVEINITASNSNNQKELESILESFKIEMTHFGSSYYKCDGNYYIMSGVPFPIMYGFQRDANNEPVIKNESYDKMKKNDLYLSPFTLWSFKLVSDDASNFDKLSQLNDTLSIELIGNGQYIAENHKVCLQDLHKYYDYYNNVNPFNPIV